MSNAILWAQEAVKRNPDCWLDFTKENIKNKVLYDPLTTKYRGQYEFRDTNNPDDKTKRLNRLVVEEIIYNTNHLIDYLQTLSQKNIPIDNDEYEAFKKHKNFLDKYHIPCDRDGYYKLNPIGGTHGTNQSNVKGQGRLFGDGGRC